MCVARHAQITQNKKFAISLQYLKKEVNDKVDLLHAGKHENLIQIDTMILMEMVKHFQSSQNSKFTISRKVDFLHTDKHQSGLEVDSWLQHFRHQSFQQGDTIIIDEHDEAFSKYSK